MIISKGVGKDVDVDKIQYCFMTKTLSKLGIEGNLLNLKRTSRKNTKIISLFNGERLDAFPLRSGTRQGSPTTSIQQCTGDSGQGNKARKKK